MARKRRLFFHRNKSLNRRLYPWGRWKRLIILALVGLISSISLSIFQPAVAIDTKDPFQISTNAQTLYSQGKYDRAISEWKKAATIYREREDRSGEMESLINMATAQYFLGNYPQSCNILLQAFGGEQFDQLDCQVLTENTITLQAELEAIGSVSAGVNELNLSLKEKLEALTPEQIGRLSPKSRKFQEELKLLIETVEAQPDSQRDSLNKATGLRRFGDVLRQLGNYQVSREVLTQSLSAAQRLNSAQEESATLISLGNIEQALGNSFSELQDQEKAARDLKILQEAGILEEAPLGEALAHLKRAQKYYQEASQRSESATTRVQAEINYLSLSIYSNKFWQADISQEVASLERQIKGMLVNLPVSRAAIYARINLVENLTEIRDPIASDVQLLKEAVKQARRLKDRQAEAYALGSLGKLYEAAGRLNEAQKLTAAALELTPGFENPEVAYLWHWQQGRILKQEGKTKLAIDSYSQAFNDLETLRTDLASINPNVQFSFRDTIEPVYRNYVSLLLRLDPSQDSQENLKTAQKVIESLQIATLDNFFSNPCSLNFVDIDLEKVPVAINKIDPEAAVIYPIVLADRLEIILTLPGEPLRRSRYRVDVSQAKLKTTIEQLRKQAFNNLKVSERLRQARGNPQAQQIVQQDVQQILSTEILPRATKLYNWLLAPLEADLKQSGVKTLVFVLDGELRNIPMALLYDGEQYLVQQDYNIALISSLRLLTQLLLREQYDDPDLKPLTRGEIDILAAGISEKKVVEGVEVNLPEVEKELDELEKNIKQVVSDIEVLRNEDFTKDSFQASLSGSNYNIVHLATHGQFSSDLKETFIVTWDELIDIKELNSFLEQQNTDGIGGKIDLLVLSACNTAEGDDRAVLGLAGVAVQGGAGSTLGTLWNADDKATADLMGEFYRNLTAEGTPVSKARALRDAQRALLEQPEYQHPYYWAPFVLVGNWL